VIFFCRRLTLDGDGIHFFERIRAKVCLPALLAYFGWNIFKHNDPVTPLMDVPD